jgi:DNA-binding NarL/FixJ family response regulator
MGRLVDESPLSPRQRQVLTLLACGLRPAEIARRLGLSLPTVRNHVAAVLRRLDSHSQLEAVAIARRRGLI